MGRRSSKDAQKLCDEDIDELDDFFIGSWDELNVWDDIVLLDELDFDNPIATNHGLKHFTPG